MQIVHDSLCLVTSAGSLPEYLIIVPIPMQYKDVKVSIRTTCFNCSCCCIHAYPSGRV